MQQRVTPRKSGFGCLLQLILVVLLGIVLLAGITAVLMPWAFFMGGRFHPFVTWTGWGRVHSKTAGGDYLLYMWFSPKTGRTLGNTHVAGWGVLCTPRGEKFDLRVGGDFEKNLRLDTNGKKASFYMSDSSATKQLFGTASKLSLELRGKWNNPDLVLDDHGSIARNFSPEATLYTAHSPPRPYISEVVPVTLHEGSRADFDAACKAVKTR